MRPARPTRLWVVAGTGTDVGKTWTACQLARVVAARGMSVAARKPAQSFASGGPERDADLLGAATGEAPGSVCPPHRWYPVAMAPPLAAEALGLAPFTLSDLVRELHWPVATDVGLVEQAGSTGSPQASDGDGVDLVRLLSPDAVVLVARPGLGTLGDIGLARRALVAGGCLPADRLVVLVNRFDPGDEVQVANLRWLRRHFGDRVADNVPALVEALLASA